MVWACWPANTVGAFFIALLIVDSLNGNFLDLPYHAIVGVTLTCLFWLVCSTFGVSISAAILVVPAVVLIIVLINTILNGQDDDGCGCDTCRNKKFVIHFKKKPNLCDSKPKPKCEPLSTLSPLPLLTVHMNN